MNILQLVQVTEIKQKSEEQRRQKNKEFDKAAQAGLSPVTPFILQEVEPGASSNKTIKSSENFFKVSRRFASISRSRGDFLFASVFDSRQHFLDYSIHSALLIASEVFSNCDSVVNIIDDNYESRDPSYPIVVVVIVVTLITSPEALMVHEARWQMRLHENYRDE